MDLPPEPPDLVEKWKWIQYWSSRAEGGHPLPFARSKIAEELSDYRTAWYEWFLCVQREKEKSRAKIEEDPTQGKEPRWYFGTFTQPDTIKSPDRILLNTRKVIKSKMVLPIEWCYSLELTQTSTPHTHFAFLTHKYPEFKKINAFNCSELRIQWRASTCQAISPEAAIKYVQKTETKPTDEWLNLYGLREAVWMSENCPVIEKSN